MAAGGDATFKINIEGNAAQSAKAVADSTRQAAAAIQVYEKEIKDLSADLRRLKGNSEDVVKAKADLKKRIDDAKGSVSKLTTDLHKQGTSYSQVANEAKKFAGSTKEAASGMAEGAKSAGMLEGATELLATAATAAAAALVAVGVAAIAGVASIIKFGLASSDAAAQMNRNREALYGNAEDAKRLGDQIRVLAGTVPQGTEELQAMTLALEKTRLSGKDIVTTMKAVAQVTGAVDASAGAKIQELVTRGQNTGRFQLNAFQNADLQGTGIDFEDVAKQYAEGAHKSVEAARRELMMGVVPLSEGAEALKKVTEKKFGDINIRNAFSLKNAPKKFFDQITSLASGIDLGPLGKQFQEVFGQLSPDHPLGKGIKMIFEVLGTAFVDIATKSIPILLEGFKYLIGGGLAVIHFFYSMRNQIKDALKPDDYKDLGRQAMVALVAGFWETWKALLSTLDLSSSLTESVKNQGWGGTGAAIMTAIGDALVGASQWLQKGFEILNPISLAASFIKPGQWENLGKQIVLGIIKGLDPRPLVEEIGNLGGSALKTFKETLGIQSPSKVFEGYGMNTVEGYAQGVDKGKGQAEDAIQGMAPGAPTTGNTTTNSIQEKFEIHIHTDAKGADGLQNPSFLAGLTQAIRDARMVKGVGL